MHIKSGKKVLFLAMAAALLFAAEACFAESPVFIDDEAALVRQEKQEAEIAYNLGIKYYTGTGGEGRNVERAIGWFRKAAKLGLAGAQYRMGKAHEAGEGTEKDYAEALKWYLLAAAQKDKDGQNGLGDLYAAGHGVERDDARAFGWYRLAAEQGVAKAQYALGMFYLSGRSVAQNYQESYFWFALAAKESDEAMDKRDEVAEYLTDEELKKLRLRIRNEWDLFMSTNK
jgi:TPR repeat protein